MGADGLRHLVLVTGDQLNRDSAAFDDFDPERDAVWMAELAHEATYVPAHQQRLVLFFAAMRHFRDALARDGVTVHYHALAVDPAADRGAGFRGLLREDLPRRDPERLILVQPGDYRVLTELREAAAEQAIPLEVREDRHFYCSIDGFAAWAGDRRSLVMEHFYRAMRRQHDVLMDGSQPVGGQWNRDADNRETFGRDGPGELPRAPRFEPDPTTRAVIETVDQRFGDHPGDARAFDRPVTPQQARTALDAFIRDRLPYFGDYQDALWAGEGLLYHSQLSAALNLHLLDPREAVDAAVAAYHQGQAPLNSVEGFVRQILGWREFVRGVYWTHMPGYADSNALDHHEAVPPLLWHGETDMACVADAMRNVIEQGYAHHIQRLMVLGLFAQLYGVHPYAFHEWHMAMYLDAVDWVSLPNTLGMSQYGDGGVIGSKPYCASGAYIQRMSNHCSSCRYNPKKAYGDDACPFTTLYWSFLDRHAERLRGNQRLVFQIRNRDRREAKGEMAPVREAAASLRSRIRNGERV
jgi:deoxyribodipyrimidine photolyase-related protein